MPVTLTIKQVPNQVAAKLRSRAAASHRSLQGELMAILMQAIGGDSSVQEPGATYEVKPLPPSKSRNAKSRGKQLTLTELWERARRLGPPSRSESATLIRSLRDERNRR
jgi:plasmid stability protein